MHPVHEATSRGRRTRPDRCPGVLRPWPAEDGGLARVRLPGGRLPTGSLRALVAVAEEYGDGRVRVTGRANLQLRGLPLERGVLAEAVVAAVEGTGLLPSRRHDLVRNVLVSPRTGLVGGRADLRAVVRELDRLVLGSPELAGLPGRFLFVLDDGRGDLADRACDLGLVALGPETCQLRVGDAFGPVVPLATAPGLLVDLAREFLERRGTGAGAAWHVRELDRPLLAPAPAAPGADVASPPLGHGPGAAGEHVPVGDAGIDTATAEAWAARAPEVVVTPWHGVLVPSREVLR